GPVPERVVDMPRAPEYPPAVVFASLASASTRLRTTFTLSMVVAWLVIGALTVGAFLLSARSLTMVFATRFARTEALLEKNRILSRVDREVALALKLADDPVVKLWAVREDDPRLRDLAMGELESYRRAFSDHSYFIAPLASRHYFIRDAAAPTMQVTTLDPALPSDQWYFQTLRTVESFALNVDYDRLIQSTKVWINAVMRDDRGVPVGVCGTGMDISSFLVEVLQHDEPNDVTILADRDGVLTAHPNFSYVIRNAEVKPGGPTADETSRKMTVYDLLAGPGERARLSAAVTGLASGRQDVVSLPLTVEGRPYLAAVAWMPSIDWFNIVLVDTSRVLRISDFSPLAATILLSLLVLLAVVALLLGRLVLRPLSALAGASREIASGRYGAQLPVSRADEIGQLTRAFNAMSATVKDTTGGLEARVQARTRDLTQANRALEESQRLIMESLEYARRVQAGILPGSEALAAALPEHTVLYLPRDVVSGDFYLVRPFGDHVVACVIDCMGHGVPGAFMTMRVHAVLSHILDTVVNDQPARILAELDTDLRARLLHDDPDQQLDSGLDIALCVWHPVTGGVRFAGAGLSLYLHDGGGVQEIRGDSRRVGYRAPGHGAPWATRDVQTGGSAALYLATDGILDQAGGPLGFGLGRARFAELVSSVAARPMGFQEGELRAALAAWQGARVQRDDITVLGFRISGGGK
ncbi:MAG TPA: SpoIIE family protein phosphatase, partial [bacterium]|nr:SpoIIE family protein phosphatase [bacterium]